MKNIVFTLLFLIGTQVLAQQKSFYLSFEDLPVDRQSKGIVGKALNLEDVENRSHLVFENPTVDQKEFTVHVWAKANKESKQYYDIISSVIPIDTLKYNWKPRTTGGKAIQNRVFEGWKISIQENGAWQFTIQNGETIHKYIPTGKQFIRDDKWHLLSFSFSQKKEEVRLYLDGHQKAILNIASLETLSFAKQVVVGSSAEHFLDKTISSEWETFYGKVDEIRMSNEVESSEKILNYYKSIETDLNSKEDINPKIKKELKVVAFNIWDGSNHTGKEVGKKRLFEMLKKEEADIFTFVETYGSGAEIADELGFYYYLISSNLSIMSRYPIEDTFKVTNSFYSGGARVVLPDGQRVNVLSIWISHLPGFRKLFKQENVSVEDFLVEDYKTRGKQLEEILTTIKPLIDQADEIPLILGGDFNSGSHLDWNESAKSIHNNYIVKFHASSLAANAELIDSYRYVYPDVVEYPGYTWSPFYKDDVKDRIDYIYYKGVKLNAVKSNVIDSFPRKFPSDHAGVSTTFEWVE